MATNSGRGGAAIDEPGITDAAAPAAAAQTPRPRLAPSADRVPLPAWLIAAALVAVELAVSGRYGFMQDELYFIEAGRHLAIAGFVRLWRTPGLRFIAVAATLMVVYVLAWIPGKGYYTDGLAPAVLAAGCAAAERWIARGRRPRARSALLIAAPLVGLLILPDALPLVPVTAVHSLPASVQQSSDLGDTIGWPQFTRAVAAQDAALARAGHPPTAIFTGYYGEAAALGVLGGRYHLPPVLSGHNAYWMRGPGKASDSTVLAVDALGQLRPYFASCRLLTSYQAPYHVQNDWTGLQIGVCTGPVAGWPELWPRLKHYG